jgi:choline-sulfatase
MNVVFILADQHNPSFTGYGGGITRTPNLDELAHDGTVFDRAYTPCPMCAPARASFFSGHYVYENKCWDNCFPYNGDKLPGWGHYFRKNGVCLATVGKLDFAADCDNGVESTFEPNDRVSLDVVSLFRRPPVLLRPKYHMANNWDVSVRKGNKRQERKIVNAAIQKLELLNKKKEPWILNINFSKPHSPWHPIKDKYDFYKDKIHLSEKYLQPEYELNPVDREQSRHTCGFIMDTEHLINCHAAYNAIVEEHDENIGEILNYLKSVDLYDHTLIIYSADHGEMLRAHGTWEKSSLYEDSVHIPMIIKYPGAKARRVSCPVSLMDIFPTCADVFGILDKALFRGESLLPFISGNVHAKHDPVFTESHANGRITGTFGIIKDEWKYLYYDGMGELLFNLKSDPQELNNLLESGNSDIIVRNKRRELSKILLNDRDPHKITENAFSDQDGLKQLLYQSGQLETELNKRGFHYDGKNLYYLP